MKRHGVSDADVLAAIAIQQLGDLNKLDGDSCGWGERLFFVLKKHLRHIRRGENVFKNRSLDRPGENGITPSGNIASIMRRR